MQVENLENTQNINISDNKEANNAQVAEILEKIIEELSQKMYEHKLLPHSLKKARVRVKSARNQK